MRKSVFILLILLMLGLSLLAHKPVFAQQEILTQKPGITPDHLLYSLDLLGEQVELFLAFSSEAKAVKHLQHAEERLAETEAMINRGKNEHAENALLRYQLNLERAQEKIAQAQAQGKDIEALMEQVAEKTLKHQVVLQSVYEKAPESAQAGLLRAIEASTKGSENALKAISGAKKEEVLDKVKNKITDIEERIPEKVKKQVPGLKDLLEQRKGPPQRE